MADLYVQNEGSIFLLHPLNDAGLNWTDAHLPEDAQKLGKAFVIEHRYIADIVAGAIDDGLEVE